MARDSSRPLPPAAPPVNAAPPPAPEPLPYRLRDNFLTPAEASFYRVLKSVVKPGSSAAPLICPKVDLSDVFFVATTSFYVAGPDQNYTYWNKINRKHVDFLLVNPLLRIPARQSYSPQDLTAQLQRLLQPTSPVAAAPVSP